MQYPGIAVMVRLFHYICGMGVGLDKIFKAEKAKLRIWFNRFDGFHDYREAAGGSL